MVYAFTLTIWPLGIFILSSSLHWHMGSGFSHWYYEKCVNISFRSSNELSHKKPMKQILAITFPRMPGCPDAPHVYMEYHLNDNSLCGEGFYYYYHSFHFRSRILMILPQITLSGQITGTHSFQSIHREFRIWFLLSSIYLRFCRLRGWCGHVKWMYSFWKATYTQKHIFIDPKLTCWILNWEFTVISSIQLTRWDTSE